MFTILFRFLQKERRLVSFLLVMLFVRISFADQYVVPSGSMIPTIHIGDRLFVNKMAYDLKFPFVEHGLLRLSEPKRGDVIVFRSPKDSVTLVKRLIGLPGDHLRVHNGFIEINGKIVEGSADGRAKFAGTALVTPAENIDYQEHLGDHSFTVQREPLRASREQLEFDIPADHYFFMGDNRDNSYDSRWWGLVPRENLKGRAILVTWNAQIFSATPSFEAGRIGHYLD